MVIVVILKARFEKKGNGGDTQASNKVFSIHIFPWQQCKQYFIRHLIIWKVITMGIIIKAICKCGFESEDIFAGGGFLNFQTNCSAPAICLNCRRFLIKNYMKKTRNVQYVERKFLFTMTHQYKSRQINRRNPILIHGIYVQNVKRWPWSLFK